LNRGRGYMKKLSYYVCISLYYLIARHLPGSDTPYSLGSKKIRGFFAKGFLKRREKHKY